MSSSRRDSGPRQVPPPPNSKPSTLYTRFIPREELQGFAAWSPGSFGAVSAGSGPAGTAPQAGAGGRGAAAGTDARHRAGDDGAGDDTLLADGDEADPSGAEARASDSPAARAAALLAAREQALRAELQADHDHRLATETAAQVKDARQQGYQDGYRDGLVALDSFKESFALQTSQQLGQLMAALHTDLDRLEQQLAASVARVATQLARQVVRSELSIRPALVAQVAQEAVGAVLVSARHITVQVHPDDQALVAQGCGDVLAARGARLQALAGMVRGGCRVESDVGSIDACLPARWAQATAALGTGVAWADDDSPGADA